VYTDECAKRWAAAGHDVTLLCAAVQGEPEVDTRPGYRVMRRGSRFGVYGSARKFIRAHRKDFDVIVDEINTRPFFAHRYAGDTPVVALAHQVAREVWFHEMPYPVAVMGRYVLEPSWLRKFADVPTLTVSDSSAESLRGYGLRNLAVIPEGVELPPEVTLPIAKAPVPTLAFCGRLVSTKRPDHAIAAFALALEQLDGAAELHLIGTGPLEDRLRASAPKGVVIHGSVGQVEKYEILGRADALICTSQREGWGLVVSEAAAVGTPTIGYDVDGLRDSVKAAGGVIVEANIEALAAAIVDWLPKFRDAPRPPLAYGGAASWDTVALDVLHHLEKVIAGDRILATTPGRIDLRSLEATLAPAASAPLAPAASAPLAPAATAAASYVSTTTTTTTPADRSTAAAITDGLVGVGAKS
jgi:glycosyltransferase involved in cell wall biosynthesis